MSVEKLGQILKKLCVCSRDHIFCRILLKIGPDFFALMISQNILKTNMLDQKLGQQVKS